MGYFHLHLQDIMLMLTLVILGVSLLQSLVAFKKGTHLHNDRIKDQIAVILYFQNLWFRLNDLGTQPYLKPSREAEFFQMGLN